MFPFLFLLSIPASSGFSAYHFSQASQFPTHDHLLNPVPWICPLPDMHQSILPHILHPLPWKQLPLPLQKVFRNHSELLHHLLSRQPHFPVHPKSLLHALLDARLDCISNQPLSLSVQLAHSPIAQILSLHSFLAQVQGCIE